MFAPIKTLLVLAALVGLAVSTCPRVEAGGNDARVRLQARLTGATPASGKAKYEARSNTRRKFSVEVERTLPSTVHTIVVSRAGQIVASVDITSNALGGFDLNLDTIRRQAVPLLQSKDVVSVWVMGELLVAGTL